MAGFREREKRHFPLKSIQSVVSLFRDQLEKSDEPNLALLSIVLGSIENVLTVNRLLQSEVDTSRGLETVFPVVEFSTVETLYTKFITIVKGSVDLTEHSGRYATRELVKKVSDVIWSSLTRSYYKDKAHLQSLYSFLTGKKLDCFGVAFAVVAACQVLGYNDVHLALSEDHAWVLFGKDGKDTAEVTWHGKGNEDKRGLPINAGVTDKSWLYLNGHPVICNRQMEVAAMASGINPAINSNKDSLEMGSLQQELLWLLYDMDHLSKYPMALGTLGNLGDLEEISPSPGRPPPIHLFQEGIDSDKKNYGNQHVYPYTYMGAHLFKKGEYKKALTYWSEASSVVKGYNYNREDEEIYKEFLEIANDMIPQIVKNVSSSSSIKPGHIPFLEDPECYADLLKFYDGICEWEEGSSTPVLHVGWATQLVFSLSKFDPRVRQLIELHAEGEKDEEEVNDEPKDNDVVAVKEKKEGQEGEKRPGRKRRRRSESARKKNKKNEKVIEDGGKNVRDGCKSVDEGEVESSKLNGRPDEDQIKSAIEELVSKVGEEGQNNAPNPNIAALAQACGESILNPEFLLGGGEPFTSATNTSNTDTSVNYDEFLSTKSNGTPFVGMTMDSMLKAESPADMMMCRKGPEESLVEMSSNAEEIPLPMVSLFLRSEKMKGLRKILSSAKLNTSAIKLQLTAQSQVKFRHSKRGSESDHQTPTRKRLRRE